MIKSTRLTQKLSKTVAKVGNYYFNLLKQIARKIRINQIEILKMRLLMGYADIDYEEAMQDNDWWDAEPIRKKLRNMEEWFVELDSQLRGSGTLNIGMIETCMEEMAFILDVDSCPYSVNIVRKGHPEAAVYTRPTKAQMEMVK